MNTTYTVYLNHWNANNGYTHSEPFDIINEAVTAYEWYKGSLENGVEFDGFTGNIEIRDSEDNLLSEYFV